MGFLLCSDSERGAFGLNHSQRRGFLLGRGLDVTPGGSSVLETRARENHSLKRPPVTLLESFFLSMVGESSGFSTALVDA